jgi:hypothetical protein
MGGGGGGFVVPVSKVAVTATLALIVTTQLAVPVQAPLQPLNVEPLAAVGVSVTLVPLAYGSPQSAPQLMPAGEELTVPAPVPALPTVNV